MSYLPLILQVVLASVVLVAAVYDMRFRRIPNWLTLTGMILGFGLNGFLYEWGGLKTAALGLLVAFLVNFPFYLLHFSGAGDVKLMAAVGAIVGWQNWLGIFIMSSILGGVLAVLLLLFKGSVRKTLWNVGFMLRELASFRAPYLKHEELDVKSAKATRLPRGVAVALGAFGYLVAAVIWAPR